MCRTGGRRCPSSRTRASGGTRGQRTKPAATRASTPPAGDTPGPASGTPAPTATPAPFNYAAPGATVGMQVPPGDTPPGGGTSTTAPPRPAPFNYAAPGANVGIQAEVIHGVSVTFDGSGMRVTTGGPGTGGTPTGGPGPDVAAVIARAREQARQAREAARRMRETAREAEGNATVNTAGSGDVIGVQAAHVYGDIHNYRA